jgi:sensor histidine kinase YesM
LLRDYLFIEQLRFSDRLTIDVAVAECARAVRIPSMLLQPLVENAIRYGIEPNEGPGVVRVMVDVTDAHLRVCVTDTGRGFPLNGQGRLPREGIGIANTRDRLRHLYGAEASLALAGAPGGGAQVVVQIPLAS